MDKSVYSGHVNISGLHALGNKLQAIAFPQVYMPLGKLRIAHVWMTRAEKLHVKVRLGKLLVDLIANLKTIRSDARTNNGMDVGRTNGIYGTKSVYIVFHDALERTFPTRMDSSNHMATLVPQENGDAVGSLDTHAGHRQICCERIHSVHGKRLL